MTSRPAARKEPGVGHAHSVYVDGRVYGWLARRQDAEALARAFRAAGRGAAAGVTTLDAERTPDELRQNELEAGR